VGEAGRAVLHCRMAGALDADAAITIRKREE
jgi:beta-galactosidase